MNQSAGYKKGVLYIQRGESLLQPGATYLFATRHIDTPWYHISAPPFDRELISTDGSLDNAALQVLAENNARVKELRAAYPSETPPIWDVKANRTYNSYQSLQSGHLFTPPPFVPSSASVTPAPAANEQSGSEPASVSPSITPTEAAISPSPTPEPAATAAPATTPEPSLAPTPSVTSVNTTVSPSPEPSANPEPSPTPTIPATSSTSQPFITPEPSATSVITATSAQ